MGLRQISLILDKRKNEEFLINKKTNDYEERNVEICVADTRGDTHRDSNKLRSAELHDDDVNIKKRPFGLNGRFFMDDNNTYSLSRRIFIIVTAL